MGFWLTPRYTERITRADRPFNGARAARSGIVCRPRRGELYSAMKAKQNER